MNMKPAYPPFSSTRTSTVSSSSSTAAAASTQQSHTRMLRVVNSGSNARQENKRTSSIKKYPDCYEHNARKQPAPQKSDDYRKSYAISSANSRYVLEQPCSTPALHASMNRIAPSEPDYLDFPRGASKHGKPTVMMQYETAVNERSTFAAARHFCMKQKSDRAPQEYVSVDKKRGVIKAFRPQRFSGNHIVPFMTSKATPNICHVPIDMGSVTTGISQQELLKKKARKDSSITKEKRSRKKKDGRLVNIPMSIIGGKTSKASPQTRGLPGKGIMKEFINPLYVTPRQYKIPSSHPVPLWEDIDGSTAETTNTGSAESLNRMYEMPYSALPAQSGVVNEADGARLFEEWALKSRASNDETSSADELFPILSKFGGHLSITESVMPDLSGNNVEELIHSQPVPVVEYRNESIAERRGVRFSSTLATSTHSYKSEQSEVPWDERHDGSSPTSVADEFTRTQSVSLESLALQDVEMYTNEALHNGENITDKRPKSILRPPRFKPVGVAGSISKCRETRLTSGGEQLPQDHSVKASIVRSPPRGSFLDREGIEVSPICKPPKDKNFSSKVSAVSKPKAEVSNAAAFRRIVEKANCLYPNPPLIEENSLYSDPPLELPNEFQLDEDDMLSAVSFIHSVAAIVIQTAYRRHQAIEAVQRRKKSLLKSLRRKSRNGHFSADQNSINFVRKNEDISEMAGYSCEDPTLNEQQTINENFDDESHCYLKNELALQQSQVSDELQQTSSEIKTKEIQLESDFADMEKRMYELAAIRIQSVFRGFWVRDCISVDHYCAKVIQAAYRGFHCRMQYNFDLYRIVLVQSVWRRNVIRYRMDDKIAATIYIQAFIRGFLEFKKYKKTLMKRRQNLLILKDSKNSFREQMNSKRSFRFSERELKNAAATLLQSTWRMYWCELSFIRTLVDVLIVQSTARGWLARKKVQSIRMNKDFSVDRTHTCATLDKQDACEQTNLTMINAPAEVFNNLKKDSNFNRKVELVDRQRISFQWKQLNDISMPKQDIAASCHLMPALNADAKTPQSTLTASKNYDNAFYESGASGGSNQEKTALQLTNTDSSATEIDDRTDAKTLLSLWKDRDIKGSLVLGKKMR